MDLCNIRKINIAMKIKYIYIKRDNTIDYFSPEISKSCFKQKLYYLTMNRI